MLCKLNTWLIVTSVSCVPNSSQWTWNVDPSICLLEYDHWAKFCCMRYYNIVHDLKDVAFDLPCTWGRVKSNTLRASLPITYLSSHIRREWPPQAFINNKQILPQLSVLRSESYWLYAVSMFSSANILLASLKFWYSWLYNATYHLITVSLSIKHVKE